MTSKKGPPLSRRAFFIYLMITYGCEPRDLFNLESATTKCYTYTSYLSFVFVSAAKICILFILCKLFLVFFNKKKENV